MDVYEAIARRRSIRRFEDKAVPWEALEKCIDAARLAPSGRNQQVCEYIVINDAEMLPGMFENIGGSATQPPDQGGPKKDANRRRVSLYDVGMAAENIILTALEQGIGACPILMFREADLKLLLDIPEKYEIALVIIMGYPDESPVTDTAGESLRIYVDEKGVRHVPKRKLADIIHRNKFTQRLS